MYEVTAVAYYPKFNFNKGIHAMWELDVADDPEVFPCSYYDICHFMGKADKPCDYVCSDDEDEVDRVGFLAVVPPSGSQELCSGEYTGIL